MIGFKFIRDKKELLSLFWGCSFVINISRLLSFSKYKRIPVLAYHRVVKDIGCQIKSNADKGLISASVDQFGDQLRYLSNNGYESILFSDLEDDKFQLPRKPVIITFDDGFSDNHSIALSVLDEFKYKAVFFVSTENISSGEMYWFEDLNHLLKSEKYSEAIYKTLKENGYVGSVNVIASCVVQFLKKMPNYQRLNILKEIKDSIGHNPRLVGVDYPMTWEQVIELSQGGHEIGSHSKTHPMLSQLMQKELIEEIEGSKKIIEKSINRNVCSFSYPFGGYDSYNDNVINVIKNAGYRYACNYISGIFALNNTAPYEINRLHVECDMSLRRFKAMLEFSYVISYREE